MENCLFRDSRQPCRTVHLAQRFPSCRGCIVGLHSFHPFGEWLDHYRAIVADSGQALQKRCQIDHARLARERAFSVDLFVRPPACYAVVDVDEHNVLVTQAGDVLRRAVRRVPVKAVEQQPHVARPDRATQPQHSFHRRDKAILVALVHSRPGFGQRDAAV
jgi:hypothetical protein